MIKQRMFPQKPGARKQSCGVDPAQRAGVETCTFVVMFTLRNFPVSFSFFERGAGSYVFCKYGTDSIKKCSDRIRSICMFNLYLFISSVHNLSESA